MNRSLNFYLAYKSAMDSQFRKWLELGKIPSSLTQKAMANITPSPSWIDFFPKKTPENDEDKG